MRRRDSSSAQLPLKWGSGFHRDNSKEDEITVRCSKTLTQTYLFLTVMRRTLIEKRAEIHGNMEYRNEQVELVGKN